MADTIQQTETTGSLVTQWALAPTDGASLAVFRVVLGLTVAAYAVKALLLGEVRGIYVDAPHHFSYYGFSWVKPWPSGGMYLHFFALAMSGVLVAAGILYRVSSVLMAVLFTFVFLCDRTAYLNHMYLICLLSWMIVVVPAHAVWSMDRFGHTDKSPSTVPTWSVWLVRFHVALPYFFGGLAKLNSDWLHGQPMRMTLSQQEWFGAVGQHGNPEWIVQIFSFGGIFFDLAIVPALLLARVRAIAFVVAMAFHFTNAFVFPIGVFPWLMIAATSVFFASDWPRRAAARVGLRAAGIINTAPTETCLEADTATPSFRQNPGLSLLAAYVVFQCIVPLRHLALPGNVSWTERGHFFAWHMMLRGKRCGLRIYATDRETGMTTPVDLRHFVTAYQLPKVGRDPEHIRQLAHKIATTLDPANPKRFEIRALALVSLNGRMAELLVDPSVNLAAMPATWTHPKWILKSQQLLPKQHWNVPLLEWETALGLNVEELLNVQTLPKDKAAKVSVPPGQKHVRIQKPQGPSIEG
ncbi:HTTM domain-containing protein [Fuerstiella marisgermanici]|uniref:Vitamin K-dependent gamma-carboxylase n=1 Tax=Fuerstiella marisgermanici TaxID=1891926 RepID=A0A1P8WNE1_9PLAN|nr:HTTM domain-containing protein [Fuerstiella marisgermanici]APZ95582.1 Vitamin K-dependent gamma-carboxylase [Fuerstiella marisgermanici]